MQDKPKDHGGPGRAIGDANRARVFKFFVENPCHTQTECAAATGLSLLAVGRHVKSIREGWRPPVHRASEASANG